MGKLLDKKINTVFEKRAQQIAQDEIQKSETRLVSRKFWNSTYNPQTNLHGGAVPCDWNGVIFPLTVIPNSDIEYMIPADARLDIPESKMEEDASVLGAGQNIPQGGIENEVGSGLGAHDVPMHGYRRGDFIKVKGISINLRAWVDKLRENSINRQYDNCLLHYKVVHVKDHAQETTALWAPPVKSVLPIRSWGFCAKIDTGETTFPANTKVRVLGKGTIALRASTDHCVQKNLKRYLDFKKKPVFICYQKTTWDQSQPPVPTYRLDSTGQYNIKGAIYLVCRSNIPATLQGERPYLSAVTKVYYTD